MPADVSCSRWVLSLSDACGGFCNLRGTYRRSARDAASRAAAPNTKGRCRGRLFPAPEEVANTYPGTIPQERIELYAKGAAEQLARRHRSMDHVCLAALRSEP